MLPLFYFPTRDVVVGLGLSISLGICAGIFPALQAMRLRVADALRRM
jgi:putative ABC transport system permease protein